MKNYIQDGERIIWINGTGTAVASGDPVIVNGRTAIATIDIANGAKGALATEGVFELAKETGKTFAQFDDLFWNATNKSMTNDIDAGAGTVAAIAGNTGNGTIGTVTVSMLAKAGVYNLICMEPTTNLGKFTFEDPAGLLIGVATVGTAFSAAGLGFTIADGATDFVSGDAFTITVAAGNTCIGFAFAAAASGDTTARVMIDSTIKR